MSDPEIFTFEESIDRSEVNTGGRHVILGNGFSVACRPEIFDYKSLFESARLTRDSPSKESLFGALETHDFETVMEHLTTAAKLAELYGGQEDLVERILEDVSEVRRSLAEVISRVHPDNRFTLSDDEVELARGFLTNFNSIYTLNYDLLLYWVLLRDKGSAFKLDLNDGFQWPSYGDRGRLIWKPEVAESVQNVFYLHGALHLFQRDSALHKLHYGNDPLATQIREAILEGEYPTIVSEGTSTEKLRQIDRDDYLRFCKQALTTLRGSLFIHGASLSSNDEHIWKSIESKSSLVDEIFVAVHGDPSDEKPQRVQQRANAMAARRRANGGAKLTVNFYDSHSVNIWTT